jgi:hypothetical protein
LERNLEFALEQLIAHFLCSNWACSSPVSYSLEIDMSVLIFRFDEVDVSAEYPAGTKANVILSMERGGTWLELKGSKLRRRFMGENPVPAGNYVLRAPPLLQNVVVFRSAADSEPSGQYPAGTASSTLLGAEGAEWTALELKGSQPRQQFLSDTPVPAGKYVLYKPPAKEDLDSELQRRIAQLKANLCEMDAAQAYAPADLTDAQRAGLQAFRQKLNAAVLQEAMQEVLKARGQQSDSGIPVWTNDAECLYD